MVNMIPKKIHIDRQNRLYALLDGKHCADLDLDSGTVLGRGLSLKIIKSQYTDFEIRDNLTIGYTARMIGGSNAKVRIQEAQAN